MIKTIFVIGKPGSGKSVMIWYLHSLLEEDGFKVIHLSDRISLEEGVLRDTKNANPDKTGIKVGLHSKLIADGPPGHRKVHVLDGVILNLIHENYVRRISRSRSRAIYLVEYAVGPVVDFGPGREKLYQDGTFLLENLTKYNLLPYAFILDISAKLDIRQERESRRADAMAPETFKSYFPDGGEITDRQAGKLKRNYYRFVNHTEDYDGYYSEARYIYESLIRKKLN